MLANKTLYDFHYFLTPGGILSLQQGIPQVEELVKNHYRVLILLEGDRKPPGPLFRVKQGLDSDIPNLQH